ncbi:spore coat protein YsxE [Heyndrickxia sp. FSL K6-6286]|uniref:spore coat protein YsxE n=1 Tax=Heyndrickxia TaxID=2837504 RepID=UPI000716ED34|nr:spore coat protein YsxE [Bacillus obstructivus]
MAKTKKTDIHTIIKQYGLNVNFYERYGKSFKVITNEGVFALKRISPQKGTDFVKNVQMLYHRGYNRIVPIYPTMDGRYGVLHENDLYYLMPWLPNEEKEDRNEKHQKMFRELARLHTLSVKDIQLSKEQRKEHYDQTVWQWERETEFFEEFLERSEQKWYMSPFELMFCTFYQDIFRAAKYSKEQLEKWYEVSKDQEKGRTVVVHGKISTEHFLYDERGYGYFSNFEQSNILSPIHDLLPFLARTLNTFPKRMDECVDWLNTYLSHFPFREDEKYLFLGYLAYPGPIHQIVEEYYLNKTKKNEWEFVKQLQRKYWLLKNTEYVVMRMNEIDKQKTDPS